MTHHPPFSSSYDPPAPRRDPPHNLEAEQQLLGTILLNNRALERVSDFLRPEHFAHALHGRIFEACGKLIERGDVASVVSLRPLFDGDEALGEAGGYAYIVRLAECIITTVNAGEYGRQIHDLAMRRRLIEIGQDMIEQAMAASLDASAKDVATSTATALEPLLFGRASTGGAASLADALKEAMDGWQDAHRRGGMIGIPTGLTDLDEVIGGLEPERLLVVGGRPGMGKTAWMLTVATAVAKAGKHPLIQSMEMSKRQLGMRILGAEAEINRRAARNGCLSDADWHRLHAAFTELSSLGVMIDDTPAQTPARIAARARQMKRRGKLDVLFVDYLGLMSSDERHDSKVNSVAEITGALKRLANELHIPVVLLAQLNRGVESRDDKRPMLSDLRDSGSIEQDADIVMFLFREQYYLERSEPAKRPDEAEEKFQERYRHWMERCEKAHNIAEIIVAKNRDDETATIRTYFDGPRNRFSNLSSTAAPDDQQSSFGGM